MGRGRPVPRRGRPPKDAESAKRLAQLRKPKYLYSGQKQQQGKSTTSSSSHNTPRSRSKKKQPWEGESDEDDYTSTSFSRISRSAYFEDADDEEDKSLLSFGDDGKTGQWDEEDDMEEDGDEDDISGSPSAPLTAFDSKLKMGRFLRARSPPRYEEDKLADMPPLKLPESSADLLLPPHLSSKYLMKILSVYEVLSQFKFQLRLSAFRLENFISSLLLNESNSLLSEIHICLLKTLIREDEANSTLFGSQDVKDSIGIYLYNCDPLTWPTTLRMYIIARRREETPDTKAIINLLIQNKQYEEYPINVPFQHKVKVLSFLCDTFLETNVARDEILNGEDGVRHDDHCRRCHKLGDLLCCDRCASVWHLGCLEPPMTDVPEDEWVCSICKQMAKETGCANEDGTIASFGDDEGLFLRRYILGWDRHGNKYWWLCRRLIIEFNNEQQEADENGDKEDKCIYISTKAKFLELMKSLDREEYEKDLYTVLNEIKDEIFKAMERTDRMTKEAFKATGIVRAMKTWIEFESEVAEPVVKEEPVEKIEEKPANVNSEGIMTRLKTGSLKEKGSGSDNGKDDEKEMLMVFDEALDPNFLYRMSRRDAIARGLFFKLGMETKNYTNIFSMNMLALNKHQLADERDKKRHLSHKFSLTPLSELKWQGLVYGPLKTTIVQTLRQTLVQFENQLAAPFMHPNWSLHRQNWLKAVSMCNQPKDFTLALSILEASMKPVLFNPVWNEALGHTILDRNTNFEREERKKDEKRERREFMEEQEMIIRTTGGVKYSIMPHRGLVLEKAGNIWFGFGTQSGSIGFGTTGGVGEGGGRGVQALWKQRGEEYRVSGSGGWMFVSIARSRFPLPSIDVERVDELEIPEEYSGELISIAFIDVGVDLRKEREDRLYYRKYRPYKNKRKGTKCIESFLDRRLQLEEAILQQKLKAEEDDRLKPEDVDEDDYDTKCYSPLCRTTGIAAFDSLCYCISCRNRQKAKRIKLEQEKKDREEREKRYKIAKQEQEKGDMQDVIADCKDRVYLNRVEKKVVKEGEKEEIKFTIFKTSGKRILGKGQLPPCNRFTTLKGKKKSIFVLPKHELRRLSRNANLREVSGFNYTGKFNKYLWPYGISPRPIFRYCWLWRNTLPQGYHNLNLVASQLRTIWSCIRWDDMQVKPPPSGNNTITNENEVITTELLKRRDLAPFGIRSEYLVRKIIVPLVNDDPADEKDTPYGPGRAEESYNRAGRRIREGLRERKKKVDEEEERRRRGPSVTESWVGEEELELWEIKMFGERLERQQQMKEIEKRKQLEESLKKQKEEAQVKRFKTLGGTPTSGKVTSLISGPKRTIFNSRTPVTPTVTSTITTTTPSTPQLITQAQQFAVIRTDSGQTFKVPASALQGKQVGQKIIIKQGGNSATSTTATIISTGTPPTVTTAPTPTIIATPRPAVTPGSTITLSSIGGLRPTRIVGSTPTVRPLILAGTPTTDATTTTPGTVTPLNNGQQRIQIIKPVVGASPQTVKTVTNTGVTINAANASGAITTPNAAGASPQQIIQIPIRFADNRVQIIQIPLSMFSSSQPIQISIPSSVTQQTTQTVTVTTTPQPTTTAAATSAQTPTTSQAIKIISSTSNLTSNPSTAASSTNTIAPNTTRIITLKTNPQPTTPIAGTSIPTSSLFTSPSTINVTEPVKPGSIQLKLNQTSSLSSSSGTITPAGTTATSIKLTPSQTLTTLTPSAAPLVSSSSTVTTASTTTTILSSPAKSTSLVRPLFQSPVGTRILVQQQPNNTATTIHKVTAPSLKLITPLSDSGDKPTADAVNKPFVLTQEIQDRIVRQALLNTNPSTSPEVQQKLLAWQKKQQQPGQVVVTPAIIDSTGTGRTLTPGGTSRSKGTKRARNSSTTTTITPATVPAASLTGDDLCLLDCQQVLNGILDKIDKDEKMELRRKKAKENQFQSKWKSLLTKKRDSLNDAAEALKRDIARKKSLMKDKLCKEIQAEITKESPVKKKETTPNKQSNGAANKSITSNSSLSNNTSSSNEGSQKRRKVSDSSSDVSRPPLKIRIKITPRTPKGSTRDSNTTNTTTTSNKNKKLYCICKTPYDPTRFMVGCDSCHNWFHSDCLRLDEEAVQKKKSWICNDCHESDEEDDESMSESSEDE
ncbi:nucleosome-remodeling factor subunit BPTF-like [Panonychus citri]|uniref:nucleosome-remodeling factor subunit BPTF-like n=1 Tax=Panonychus citri TaxID=50023 RepID=UPI002308077E|nr:nucleosome-remodeling factor subunit BPTF-like [Panonychus citri]